MRFFSLRQPHRVTPGRTNNILIHPLEKTYRGEQILYKGEVGVGEDGGGCGGGGVKKEHILLLRLTSDHTSEINYAADGRYNPRRN